MKKLGILLISIMMFVSLVGCGGTAGEASITVYTRDSSSGTREAFFGFINLEENLTADAVEVTGNGDMATKVGQDENGIGYISLDTDFDANNVVGLSYNGVEPTKDNVVGGSYELARPFSYVTRASGDFDSDDKEALVAAFLDYLNNSSEGALALTSAGAIVTNESERVAWSTLAANHPVVNQDNSSITITTVGSTSVEKSIKVVLESFQAVAGNVQFVMNHSGSSDGFKRVLGEDKDSANAGDIGFASREFKSEETVSDGLQSGVFALDAVVVAISKDNTSGVTNLTTEQLYNIFSGTTTTWSELSN